MIDSSEPDPIFAAIERHRELSAQYDAAVRAFDAESLEEHPGGTLSAMKEAEGTMYRVANAELDALRELSRVVPTTLQGLLALLVYAGEYHADNSCELYDAFAEDGPILLTTLATAAKALQQA